MREGMDAVLTAALMVLAMGSTHVGATAPGTIKIIVSAEDGTPVAARISINRDGQWTSFNDTGADGRLIRHFTCVDGVRFRASPRSSLYYNSDEQFCDTVINLRVMAKLRPSLVQQDRHRPLVGGAAMYPTKTIVANAVNSKDHTTLVAAIKAAGLVDSLSGPGPFTVFAPTNEAFAKLPAGTVDTLVRPENRDRLNSILTYHVIPGRITAADIAVKARANGGIARYATVQGGTLRFRKAAGGWTIIDAEGHGGKITIPDIRQSNGIVHVIDAVMLP